MATLNTEAAQRKWDDLLRTESATIERIVQGTADKSDYSRLVDILRQYSAVAHDVFRRGLQLIERDVERTAEERIQDMGVPPDSNEAEDITQQVRQEVHAEKVPELVEAVRELIEEAERPEDTQDVFHEEFSESEHHAWDPKQSDIIDDTPNTTYSVHDSSDPIPVSIDDITDEAAQRLDGNEGRTRWASYWWRQFHQYVGRKYRNTGMLKELAALAAAAYAFSPTIRDWVNDKVDSVSKYFTFDYMKEVLANVWDYIKEQGSAAVNWIMDQLKKAGGWVSDKVDNVVEYATETYEGAKQWTVDQFTNVQVARHQHHVNVYGENAEKHQKRLIELQAQRDGESETPLSPKQRLQIDKRIRIVETAIENAKKNQQYHREEIERLNNKDATDANTATATAASTASASTGQGSTSSVPASTGSVAIPVAASSASIPEVTIPDSAAPPTVMPTPEPGQPTGATGGPDLAPNMDSFSYAPHVDDRLLLANLLA